MLCTITTKEISMYLYVAESDVELIMLLLWHMIILRVPFHLASATEHVVLCCWDVGSVC